MLARCRLSLSTAWRMSYSIQIRKGAGAKLSVHKRFLSPPAPKTPVLLMRTKGPGESPTLRVSLGFSAVPARRLECYVATVSPPPEGIIAAVAVEEAVPSGDTFAQLAMIEIVGAP